MEYIPGDFILVHGTGFFDKLIQYGERFHFNQKQAFWNHTALVVSADGGIVEAIGKGVKLRNIDRYPKDYVQYVHVEMSEEDRTEAVHFALDCATRHDSYGFWGIFSAGLRVLFNFNYYSGFGNQLICSELVGKSLEHGGKILARGDAINTSPADLATQFLI
jgi:hypothetical protein